MKQKPYSILSGVLMHPLTVGGRALIRHEGRYVWTSTVVAIHDITPDQIVFETLNTHYLLLKPTTPQAASLPLPAMTAA